MEKLIKSKLGNFFYNENFQVYELKQDKLHWTLDSGAGKTVCPLIEKAETLFTCLEEFDQRIRFAIAEKLIDYKNDFWPEYDENDEYLDWDAVDAGELDVSKEDFAEAIVLYYIKISTNNIYCEFYDGDLFGGHRIHAHVDDDYNLLRADI
ncbi:DUF2262 domain-containing protein [Gracilibacillus oryzae]|uniref:DUF2262 domain-containing protein n=1 Tax=Gracilibacillus oryzae TaxID=1672701 RepID=A0A7C8KPW9_9BACI|nr:DUF2262 domain-containing protein [Gracilibacillus oryzae]KAB8126223.1 DUF2262 domain-containing protein [Gracilibacillus oryzae]